MKLWLDDIRPAPEGWTWHFHVDTMINDIKWLMNHNIEIEMISLDNDLDMNSKINRNL